MPPKRGRGRGQQDSDHDADADAGNAGNNGADVAVFQQLQAQVRQLAGVNDPAAFMRGIQVLRSGGRRRGRRRGRRSGGDDDDDSSASASDGSDAGRAHARVAAPSAAVVAAHQSASLAARAEGIYNDKMARYAFPRARAGKGKFTESIRRFGILLYTHRATCTGRMTYVYGDVDVWSSAVGSLRAPDSFEDADDVRESGSIPAVRLFLGCCSWCLFPPESRYTMHDMRTDLARLLSSALTLEQLNDQLRENPRLRSLCDVLAVLLHLLHSVCEAGWSSETTTVHQIGMCFCDLAERHYVRARHSADWALEEQHAQASEKLGLLTGYGSRVEARPQLGRVLALLFGPHDARIIHTLCYTDRPTMLSVLREAGDGPHANEAPSSGPRTPPQPQPPVLQHAPQPQVLQASLLPAPTAGRAGGGASAGQLPTANEIIDAVVKHFRQRNNGNGKARDNGEVSEYIRDVYAPSVPCADAAIWGVLKASPGGTAALFTAVGLQPDNKRRSRAGQR